MFILYSFILIHFQMGLFNKIFGKQLESKLHWTNMSGMDDLDAAIQYSFELPVGIFKHSTRCSISAVAKSRLERGWGFEEGQEPKMYYLDLIVYREVSNAIASRLGIHHESPQLILLRNGAVVYDASHSDITVQALQEALGWNKE